MLKVILDTNILRENGINKADMVMLSRLSREEVLEVYVPTIVKREYLSQQYLDLSEECQRISNSLHSIRKRMNTAHPNYQFADEMANQLKLLKSDLENPIYKNFEEWMAINGIKEINFKPKDITDVVDEYFTGCGVFKKAKHRDDFPDAMISKSILAIARTGAVTVLCKDGNFKEKLSSYENVSVTSSLRDYLDTPEISDLRRILDERTSKSELIKEIIKSDLSQQKLKEFLLSEEAYIEDVYLTSDEITGTERLLLESAYNEDIQFIDTKTITDIELGEVRYVSDDMYSVDIQFISTVAIRYAANYGDFHALKDSEQDKIDVDGMNGDGYSEFCEVRDAILTGAIEIYLNSDLIPEQLAVHMQYFSHKNPSVSGTVEVQSAKILPSL